MKTSGRWAFVLLLVGIVGPTGCTVAVSESIVAQVRSPQNSSADQRDARQVPQTHEVRKQVANASDEESPSLAASEIPPVHLTTEHAAMCRLRVGDELPEINLPQLAGGPADLASLRGKHATIVLFWQSDPWMSESALRDLSRDYAGHEQVSVVGIAVKEPPGEVETMAKETGVDFPQLIDADGKAFNKVGMVRLPRLYVLDAEGRIVWFDIEYSQSSQRELKQAVAALVAQP